MTKQHWENIKENKQRKGIPSHQTWHWKDCKFTMNLIWFLPVQMIQELLTDIYIITDDKLQIDKWIYMED
jgi:hypothetical protein